MNPTREPSAVVAAWLDEGPNELPESTRRAIAVDVRTTHQSRNSTWFPWRFPWADRSSLVALAAVAVIVLAVAGLALPRFAPDKSSIGGPPPSPTASASPSPSEAPSATTPRPTNLVVPAMTETYVSTRHGYSVMYPARWSVEAATEPWWPPDWKATGSPGTGFDYIVSGGEAPKFRAASAALPAGLPNTNDWIDEFLTFGDPSCIPPRERQELISIDGAPGRLTDSCRQVEATVVLEGRVYMFTLDLEAGEVANGRQLFDAFAATIDLRPEEAGATSPSP